MRAGETLGEYVLLAELGRGGMGVVWKARHPSRGSVALKVMSALHDDADLRRFIREAQAGISVTHPNVLGVLDAGRDGDRPFIVLELATGGSLADRLKRGGALPWREAAAMGAAIARGLAAVHDARLVHRDLKPSNVLLDAEGTPRLADFGIVRVLDRSTLLTETSEVPGSASYMSPEQATGEPATAASDVYALGCVLHELLTGAPPFAGTGLGVLSRHASEAPRGARGWVPSVPPALERIVLRLLSKEPESRGSAADLARDLDDFLAGKRSRRWPPLALAGMVLLSLAVAATVLALVRSGTRPAKEGDSAEVTTRTLAGDGRGAPPAPAPVASAAVTCLAWSETARELAVGHEDGLLTRRRGREPPRAQRFATRIRCLAYSPDGETLAVGTEGGLSLVEGRAVTPLGPEAATITVAFEREDLLWATRDRRILHGRDASCARIDAGTGAPLEQGEFVRGDLFATFEDGSAGRIDLDGHGREMRGMDQGLTASLVCDPYVLHVNRDTALTIRDLDRPSTRPASDVKEHIWLLIHRDERPAPPFAFSRTHLAAAREGEPVVRIWAWAGNKARELSPLTLPRDDRPRALLVRSESVVVGTQRGAVHEVPLDR